jgi:hypothetical protein
MSRQLATIQKISSLQPIIGADKIEKVTILGWEVVVKKDSFKLNELCVYCEIDSILPDKPEFEFLKERKFRIKTIKLKKQISQGICFPLSILPSNKKYKENDDVSDILEIKKYDPQLETEESENSKFSTNRFIKFFYRFSWFRKLICPKKLSWPQFIRKTNETRIQQFCDICNTEKDTILEVTEKLDGQSATYFLIRNKKSFLFGNRYTFGVCSRNIYLKKPNNSSYWEISNELKIERKLKFFLDQHNDLNYVVLQGEILGKKIQGNKYNIENYKLYLFNAFTDKDNNIKNLICSLFNLESVPLLDGQFKLKENIPAMVEYSKGKSKINNKIRREGIVLRNYEKGLSLKVINPEFLLEYDE